VLGCAGPLLGFDVTTLVRPLDNPLLQAWVDRKRRRFGAQLAANRGGLAELFAGIESGRQVAVLADLNHRGRGAAFIEFFGVKAATARTIAVLALKYDRPVIPVFCHRLPDGRFGFDTGEPVVPDPSAPREAEVQRILQSVAAAIEARIRETPGAWLWTHPAMENATSRRGAVPAAGVNVHGGVRLSYRTAPCGA
jgi:KDO2-lipid IV(A) lauroyltransferase